MFVQFVEKEVNDKAANPDCCDGVCDNLKGSIRLWSHPEFKCCSYFTDRLDSYMSANHRIVVVNTSDSKQHTDLVHWLDSNQCTDLVHTSDSQ